MSRSDRPLTHRPFLALITERKLAPPEPEPDRRPVEVVYRRRRVTPSWQREPSAPPEPCDHAGSENAIDRATGNEPRSDCGGLVSEVALAAPSEPEPAPEPEPTAPRLTVQLSLPDIPVASFIESERESPRTMKKSGNTFLSPADKQALIARARKASAARKAGDANAETYDAIGKDYGVKATSVYNIVSTDNRKRAEEAQRAKRAASRASSNRAVAAASVEPVASEPRPSSRGLSLRFDRAIDVTIVGLDEYIQQRVKEGVALALRRGIG